MKKLLSLLIASLSISANAQNADFILTHEGFRDKADNSKDYIVIDTPGSQTNLYSRAKTNISAMYRSPKDVLSEAAPEMITITGYSDNTIFRKSIGVMVVSYEMNYTINLRFKDDKIRIDAPFFELYNNSGDKKANLFLVGTPNLGLGAETTNYIYNKKGELREKWALVQLENFFNSFIRDLINSLESGDDW